MKKERTLSLAACAVLSVIAIATAGLSGCSGCSGFSGCSKGGKESGSGIFSGPSEGKLTVTVFAYCPCAKCNTPQWKGMVSSGERMKKLLAEGKNICAADPSVIPMGATVTYNGRNYIVADTGSNIKGNTINILLGSHSEVYAFGVKKDQTITYKK